MEKPGYIDITEHIAAGDVMHIISCLTRWKELGYDRLYWDGYDSSIHLYKSCDCSKINENDVNTIKSLELILEVQNSLLNRWKEILGKK